MQKELLMAGIGLALFIVLSENVPVWSMLFQDIPSTSLVLTAFWGQFSPYLWYVIMVWYCQVRESGAHLVFACFPDLGAAIFMKQINPKAGIETLVIAVFVIAGVDKRRHTSEYVF